jgi:hypothetical protein
MFSGQFADIDAGASFGGIAVVGNSANAATEGTWQYSTNGGVNWFNIGSVSDGASALALSTSTRIRFVPAGDYNGVPTPLVVRGLDNTYGGAFSSTAGVETRIQIDTTTRGGTTAISAATANLATNVMAVNDEPSFLKGADQLVGEDAGPQTVLNWATAISAGPANEAGQTVSFVVVNNTNAGLFSAGPAVSSSGTLTYTTAANQSGVAVITIRIVDDGGTASGGDDSSPTQVFTITVISINDAPTLGNGTLASVAEDTATPSGQSIAAIFGAQFNDVDPGATFGGVAIVANAADPGVQGVWQYSANGGADWFNIGPVNGANALALDTATLVRFLPAADYYGSPPPLVARAIDDTYLGGYSTTAGVENRVNVNGLVNGGATAISAATANLNTTVTAVNDPPNFSIASPLTINPVNPLPVPVIGAITGPPNENHQTLSWSAVSSDPAALPHPTVLPDGNGGFMLHFVPAPFRNVGVPVTVTVTDSDGLSHVQVVNVNLVVGQVPPPNLQFEAPPTLTAVPVRDQEIPVDIRTTTPPLVLLPLENSGATGDAGAAGERAVEIYVVDPATGEVTEKLPFELKAGSLDELSVIFRDLPDDRYRILLRLEDGTRRLVRDVLVRDGKPFDPGDEKDQFVEPIERGEAMPVVPAKEIPAPSQQAPPAADETPLAPPGQTREAAGSEAIEAQAASLPPWWIAAPSLAIALAAQQRAKEKKERVSAALSELGKKPWLRHWIR